LGAILGLFLGGSHKDESSGESGLGSSDFGVFYLFGFRALGLSPNGLILERLQKLNHFGMALNKWATSVTRVYLKYWA
jgi:hypothetical protein